MRPSRLEMSMLRSRPTIWRPAAVSPQTPAAPGTGGAGDTASAENAVAANDYWTWGFDVSGPVSIDLTTFDIRLDRSGTGPTEFEITARVNGGTLISLLADSVSESGTNFIGKSLAALPNLTFGDSVEFTLAAFNSTGTSGTLDLESLPEGYGLAIYGDITTSAIPEPSTAIGMITLLGFAVLLVRRRD